MAVQSDIEKTLQSLRANNFKAIYVEKAQEAVPIILDLIPRDASIELAGSVSVGQLGLLDRLRERGNQGLDFLTPGRSSFEEMRKNRKDVLLVSTNALTLDGQLVNTDGIGNRVAGMFFGVKQVVLLVGANKIVQDLEEAMERVRKTISPYHAKCLGVNTPCAVSGECMDCDSPQRICNVTSIIWKKPPTIDFTVVLVGEDLGLGWDPAWPQERIEKITSAYRTEIEKFKATLKQQA